MLELFAGIISGIVSGTGMGGGTILILILSAFMGIDQHLAQGTNLLFFVPTALSSILVSNKEKLINWRIGIIVAIFGVIGAVLGAKISIQTDAKVLKKYFGIFLLILAMYEIYTIVKNKEEK